MAVAGQQKSLRTGSFKKIGGDKYDLRVTCRYLRDVLDKMNGLKKLNEQLKEMTFAHVRVGLAKPYYKQNNHCFLMCNGIFLY